MPNDEKDKDGATTGADAAPQAAPAPDAVQDTDPPETPVERLPDAPTAPGPFDTPAEGDKKGAKAKAAADPSNTYELGVQPKLSQPGVNYAVPEGAKVTTTLAEALEEGYLGYAPGAGSHEAMTAQAAGKRNERIRDAQRASINAASADVDASETKRVGRASR
jgi:hypothetical protein